MGFYQDFKKQIVAKWRDNWTITSEEIVEWHQKEIERRRIKITKKSS